MLGTSVESTGPDEKRCPAMMPEQPARAFHTREVGHDRLQRARVAGNTHVALFSGVQRRQLVSERPRTVPPRLAVGKVVVWVCLVIVLEVAVGHGLQLAAENTASRADASELAPPMDILDARGTCPALDQYVHRALTRDELRDLQEQPCPILSEPQRTGN